VATIGHAADQGKHPWVGGAGQAMSAAANIPPQDYARLPNKPTRLNTA
jgi:hypothetical protein